MGHLEMNNYGLDSLCFVFVNYELLSVLYSLFFSVSF